MNFETIVSTMFCNDISDLLSRMKVKTSAIVINQSDKFDYETGELNNCTYKAFSFREKGVGLSRNNGLMRSSNDICIIADDDLVYRDNYLLKIEEAYKKFPDADIICFGLNVINGSIEKEIKLKSGRLSRMKSLKIGTPMITFKRKSILKSLLSFSLLFGGGTVFGSGEDTLFIQEAFRKKLKIYQYDFIIADVYNDDSSWFEGYNKKFFFDKGALYRAAFPKMSQLMILQFLIRKRKLFKDWKFLDTYREMQKGAKSFSNTNF